MNRPILNHQQPQSYSQNLYSQHLTGGNSTLDILSSGLNNQNIFQNNPGLAQLAIGAMTNTQQNHQTLLPNIVGSSSLAAQQAGMASTTPKHDLNFLTGTSILHDKQIHTTMPNTNFDMQDNADQHSLEKLLTASSAQVKQSLLEKLQNEGNISGE